MTETTAPGTPSSGTSTHRTGGISTWQAIRLVAGREVRTKALTRSFVLTTLVMLVGIVLGGGLMAWLGAPDAEKVAVVPESRELGVTLRAMGEVGDTEVELVDVADREEGEQLVADGEADVLLLAPDRDAGVPMTVVVESELPSSLTSLTSALAQQEALSAEVDALGGDPGAVASALAEAGPEVEPLEGQDRDGAQVFVGFVAGILIFIGVMGAGQMVAQGVVEEKASRVVELLLATVRPWQLMAGKVLGIGLVGLIQVAALAVTGAATAVGFDLLETSSLDLGAVVWWTLGWFVVGYLTYAVALAGLAALVSRQEDVAQAVSPVMMLMMVPYLVAVAIAPWDPDNIAVVALSFVPFCAPMLMPVRIALDSVETWEVLLSLGLSLAVLPLLVWVAGRLYARGVLRTGARVKLLAALRS